MNHKIVFVGQGPNAAAWERGLAIARSINPKRAPELLAERYCARIALTGAVGIRLGLLLGIGVGDFFRRYERRNLNARFNGKKSKGDEFDRVEGKRRAEEILAEGFTRVVCLGNEVGACFGIGRIESLGVRGRYIPTLDAAGAKIGERYVELLLLPHPSGIVQWWNDDFNRSRARRRLREFVEQPTNA